MSDPFEAMTLDMALGEPIPCPHCIDGHSPPTRVNWGAFVSMERDHDGQPYQIIVCPTNGKGHMADSDAEWVAAVLRAENGARCVAFIDAREHGGWCYHPHFKHRAAVTKA